MNKLTHFAFFAATLILSGLLPATLAPGQVVQGSFFFRLSPGPRSLTLHCRVGGEPQDVSINLSPLAGLHFQQPATAGK